MAIKGSKNRQDKQYLDNGRGGQFDALALFLKPLSPGFEIEDERERLE